jgi:hypothetical protein
MMDERDLRSVTTDYDGSALLLLRSNCALAMVGHYP